MRLVPKKWLKLIHQNQLQGKITVYFHKYKITMYLCSLQIRLADGSRLVGQFNHDHTVAQVRQYIITARPQYQTQTFNLLSTYPSKILEDALTLKEAGLLNSSIMQKLT